MSPAAKSKSKSAAKAAKEQSKMSPKLSSPPSNGNGVSASAYNPVSGTFHSLETMPPSPVPSSENNSRFRTIDDTEDHSGSSFGTTAEYDSMSNNGSGSEESEDQKEKMLPTPPRMEPIPGADTEKRDKIRQKNEKKHQRQRERRAQELHERCSGYLMSRKLEALAQQLVAMGFSSEQATMALMLNEGRVEESVAWLLEGGQETKQEAVTKLDRTNLKIDIADELAKIADMEVRFKCNKQEVERAVVSCEGELEKAVNILKSQKQESAASACPPKLEEPSDPVALNGSSNKVANSAYSPLVRTQLKGVVSSISLQQRDLHYAKAIAAGSVPQEVANRNLQSFETLRRLQPKPDMLRPQAAASLEKRWLSVSSGPSASYTLAPPLQIAATPVKSEARFGMVGNEVKTNLQAGTLREPVIVMQRPQPINGKQNLPSPTIGINGSPPASTGWYPNEASSLELKVANGGLTNNLPKLLNGSRAQPYYPQSSFQPFAPNAVESGGTGRGGGSWSTTGTSSSSSSPLAVPSSLGLFTGWGSSGSSVTPSPVDWSTGRSVSHFDYSSIDWSLDPMQLKPERPLSSESWSASLLGMKASARELLNGGGMSFMGLQDGGNFLINPSTTIGPHEWTSPFAGRDLFRVPRQFVTSPSL